MSATVIEIEQGRTGERNAVVGCRLSVVGGEKVESGGAAPDDEALESGGVLDATLSPTVGDKGGAPGARFAQDDKSVGGDIPTLSQTTGKDGAPAARLKPCPDTNLTTRKDEPVEGCQGRGPSAARDACGARFAQDDKSVGGDKPTLSQTTGKDGAPDQLSDASCQLEEPQGLKPGSHTADPARLKPCPDTKLTTRNDEAVEDCQGRGPSTARDACGTRFAQDDNAVEDELPDSEEDEEEAAPEVTDEKAEEISAFIMQDPPSEAPNTAQEKRLAAKRHKIEDQLKVMHQIGALIDSPVKKFPLIEGGKTYKVSVRELLMRRHLKIRNKNGRLVQFKVNAAQRDYAKTAAKKNIVLKARQLGFTTYVAARFFLNCIARPGTVCVQVAHDQHSAEQIFRIVHRMLANMPDYLRKGVLATSHANRRQIIFPHIDSSYMVETANENAGRGLTIHNLHCSEVARWPGDAAATLAALRAAVPPDGEIVLESTANGACGCFYDEWLHAEEKGYSRHFYPWWWEKTYKRPVLKQLELTEEELELQMRFGLTPEQIVFRREMKSTLGSRAAEEYAEDAESCFRASGECYFDLDVVEARLHNVECAVTQTDSGRTLTFYPAQPSKEYIIGVDPAGGGSAGDYSCAQVIDRASGMQVCELRGHLGPQELASRVAMLARQYNYAEVAVERNNHGHAVHAYLGHYAADIRVYHQKGQAGWLTSAASRPWMLDNLAQVLVSAPYLFSSKRLLEELKTFVKRPDGSSAAANGTHDDTVMAMAIAQVVRTQGATKVKMPEVGVLESSS